MLEKAFYYILIGFFRESPFMSENLKNHPTERWNSFISTVNRSHLIFENREFFADFKNVNTYLSDKMFPKEVEIQTFQSQTCG
jgi:hypothetical protein